MAHPHPKSAAVSKIHSVEIPLSTKGETDIIDVTARVENCLHESGVQHGQALVFCPGSTVGLTTVEFEPGLVKDLKEAFEKLAPRAASYHHEQTWQDGNGYAHVRASLLGQTQTFPVINGRLIRGTWQQIVLIDFDNHPRRRSLVVQISGE